MPPDTRKAKLKKLAERDTAKYGELAALVGRTGIRPRYYPIHPALDYVLGTGGFPDNGFVEAFGPPEIGKTTIYGAAALSSVQQAGGVTATIAIEPQFDELWLEEHGVDPELNIIYRPDTGEEAYEILKDLIYNRDVDYILWDSLAATSSKKEQDGDKPMAFGNASLNSWGIKNVATRAWKNRVGVLFINQIRDNAKSPIPGAVKSTGGWSVEHFMTIRLQLKPGKDRYKVKVPSMENGKKNEDLVVGQEIRSVILKNKGAEELAKTAVFDFYPIHTDEFPFGFNKSKELVNVGLMSGVLTGSGWINHDLFPDGKINGKPKAIEFLDENPDVYQKLYNQVMEAGRKKSADLAAKKKEKKS